MKIIPLHKTEDASKALLFFAGWGMDEYPFLDYRPKGHDLLLCYDYRTLEFDASIFHTYSSIDTVAWSMGVWAASHLLPTLAVPVNKSIAINGTPFPIDEKRGIPPAIFQGTLEGLNEASLLKFQRRMCAGGEAFKQFSLTAPRRSIEELKEELAAISLQYEALRAGSFRWQEAFIGSNDRIFPPANQQAAWQSVETDILTGEEAHYDKEIFSNYLEKIWTSN